MPSLDILIPTKGRPEQLAITLTSISSQDFSAISGAVNLYILDNGEFSAFYKNEFARLLDLLALRGIKTFYLKRSNCRGIFWIRQELYQVSSGDVVLYLDDDVVLTPGFIQNLWFGVVNLGINLTTGFIIDVDGLSQESVTNAGHAIRATIERTVNTLKSGRAVVIGSDWMELLSATGATLMFKRSDFNRVGAWEKLAPAFENNYTSWAEDLGLCVALKSLGSAFVSVRDLAFHFTVKKRSFAGFHLSEAYSEFLVKNYGIAFPSDIGINHPEVSPDVLPVIATLKSHFKHFGI
jgi:glycosyltransferase involved in cell wall biosynthesis